MRDAWGRFVIEAHQDTIPLQPRSQPHPVQEGDVDTGSSNALGRSPLRFRGRAVSFAFVSGVRPIRPPGHGCRRERSMMSFARGNAVSASAGGPTVVINRMSWSASSRRPQKFPHIDGTSSVLAPGTAFAASSTSSSTILTASRRRMLELVARYPRAGPGRDPRHA